MTDPPATKSSRIPLIVAVVTGLVASAVVYVLLRPEPQPDDRIRRADCVDLQVSSSTEKDELLTELADRYNRTSRLADGRCATVRVNGTSSGVAMAALERGWNPALDKAPVPQVWMPTSSLWLELLNQRRKGTLSPAKAESVTKSVLSVAMPERMATALDLSKQQLGWSDILALATDPAGWGSKGHPEWGRFALGRDNPFFSTSGLAATIATYYAAVSAVLSKRGGITEADLGNAKVLKFVHGVESSVARYGDDSTVFMQDLYEQSSKGPEVPYISAIVVQEQLVHLYNHGAPTGDVTQFDKGQRPKERLVAVQPKDGTLVMDHPYAVLPTASPDQQRAAKDFSDFLLEPDQQRRFAELGFRDRDHPERPTRQLIDSVGAKTGKDETFIDPPSAELIGKMREGWNAARRKARVLLVLDVSGSMNDPADSKVLTGELAGKKKVDLLRPAVSKALEWLSPEDHVGLWTFSSDPAYTERVPIGPVSQVKGEVNRVIQHDLRVFGNTALYETAVAAQKMMLAGRDPERINAVVLLTDGRNTPPNENARNEMLKQVDAATVDSSVRIFTIPYGSDAERETLAEIAKRSKAALYDATVPADIDAVFLSAFSNF